MRRFKMKKGKRRLAVAAAVALLLGSLTSPFTTNEKSVKAETKTYPWTQTAETTGDYISDSYNVGSDHVFESVTQERLLDILSSSGNYYIVFGGPEQASSQKIVPLINEQAKKDKITKIYHFDPFIDGYQIDITDENTKFQGNYSWNADRTEKLSNSVYKLWERIEALLPEGTLDEYTSKDTLLISYSNDRKTASVKASYLYKDGDSTTTAADEIAKVFRGGSADGNVTAGSERTDFEFFKRVYNGAATYIETSRATEPTADRLAKETEIFTDADKEGFALHQVNYTELLDILRSPGKHYIFFGASWCHNTQAIIGSVARKAKENGVKTVYVYDTTVGNQLEFGTGADIDKVTANNSAFNSRNSVDTENGYNNISYLYGTVASYLGDFLTENNTNKNNSISYYPNGDITGTSTSVAPWETADAGTVKKAIRLQMPFFIQYDKSEKNPVTKQWLHKNSADDGTYTEYMLELAWVRATAEAKADTDTSTYDGLTKVEFAAEAVQALDVVFGKETQEQPTESIQPQPTETVQPTAGTKTKTTKPKAPVLKSVKAGKKTAKVTWSRVTGVKGYVVYRAASKKGTYKKVAAVSGAKKTSYQVKKLKSKKKYFFKVKSYTLNGKTKVYSGWSNSKSVKVK